MALDLFFVPRKPPFAELRDSGFELTPGMTRVRRKLLEELLEAYPGSRLEGEFANGHIADFPRGEMNLHQGYIGWSLHGVTDEAPIHEIVNWFLAHGYVCEDPQDAGFGNRDLKRGAQRMNLESFEELVGAEFVGVRLLREWVAGIATDWTLADGSHAMVQFVRFEVCRLPDLGRLLTSKVIAIHYETPDRATRGFDTLRVFFEGDLELVLEGAVFQKSVVTRHPATGD